MRAGLTPGGGAWPPSSTSPSYWPRTLWRRPSKPRIPRNTWSSVGGGLKPENHLHCLPGTPPVPLSLRTFGRLPLPAFQCHLVPYSLEPLYAAIYCPVSLGAL